MPPILSCRSCKKEYDIREPIWRCSCGGLLDISIDIEFRINDIQSTRLDLWRYQKAIPVNSSEIISFGEGLTPLLKVEIRGREVLIKQDHIFPTGSYKDRGASVLISQIKLLGIRRVVEDSSGNAGCAIAAYCAKAGIACDIYVPAGTSPAKLAQIESYNATLHKIPGSREDTAAAVMAAAQKHYYASHSWNPFFFQGTKTFAYEICEQLNWQAPDYVILPVGNGTLLLGASIGFTELRNSGIIKQLPRLIGVQSEGCAPLIKAFTDGVDPVPWIDKKDTLAEGIAIAQPARGKQILGAVRESGGKFVSVSDDEITQMVIWAGRQGFYIEPTAGAAIAGLAKIIKDVPDNKTVVTVFTGHGLKASEKILKLLN